MKDGKRTTSIARRIAWNYRWKRLFGLICQTLLLAAAALFGWCSAMHQQALGGLWPQGSIVFSFQAGTTPVTPSLLLRALRGESVFARWAEYRMEDGASVEAGDFLFWLAVVLSGVLLLRLGWWLLLSLRETRRVRRYLKPIDDIAQVTESISSRGFDESKFHSLEEAIDHIEGVSADEQLRIGDKDLAGLETAVNNLITRMHNTYRQQVRFVDDASHELRTPIAVIQGYADMLDRWGKSDEQVLDESIRAIRTETEHMKTLVEQLLFLARGDAGRQTLRVVRLDASALMAEVWEECRMIDPGHEYILRAGGPVYVMADEAMLKQTIRILTDNAAKYSPADSRITLRAEAENGEVRLTVQDNGIGVSKEDALRMFDRFYRADAARSSQTGGSGLGLSIARWIVGRHGGRFEVTSFVNVGMRITVILPEKSGGQQPRPCGGAAFGV